MYSKEFRPGLRLVLSVLAWLFLCQLATLNKAAQGAGSGIGREVSVARHLQDGREFSLSIEALLQHGKVLFNANWTEQEGGGRPLTKGTGRPLSDPSRPLVGDHAFNRVSGP